MNDVGYLFLAFALIWAGVAFYLFRLATLRRQLAARVQRMEEQLKRKMSNDG